MTSGIASVPRKLRMVHRAREVATVLIAHGLSDLVSHFHWPSWLVQKRPEADTEETAERTSQERLCDALEELGPTFVKLGQFLSTREDLVPTSWAKALSRLQDDVQPVVWEEIEEELRASLGDRFDSLFTSVEQTPLAAGSIAQVHRARLANGRAVVLKVLRPGVRRVIQADLEVMALLASFAEDRFAALGFQPREVVEQFAEDRLNEIDLLHEGRATDRLRRLFREEPEIVFPEVFWSATTQRVLVLEELVGVPFTRLPVEELAPETRREIVRRGCRAVLRQCLEFGFFHADPHPGNLLLLDEERIGFVDSGIVGYLDSEQRHRLVELVRAVAENDVERVQIAATSLADCPPELADDRQLRRGLNAMLVDLDATSLEGLDVTALLRDLFMLLREFDAAIPAELLKLVATLSTLQALALRIDPEYNVVEEVAAQTRRLLLENVDASTIRRRSARVFSDYASLLEDLPRSLRSVLEQARGRKLGLTLTHAGLDRLTAALLFSSRLLASAILVASLLVTGAIILNASAERAWLEQIGLGALVAAVVFAVVVGARHFRYRDRDRRPGD